MHTKQRNTNSCWYDTPLGQLYGGESRRRAQPTVAQVVADLTRRQA